MWVLLLEISRLKKREKPKETKKNEDQNKVRIQVLNMELPGAQWASYHTSTSPAVTLSEYNILSIQYWPSATINARIFSRPVSCHDPTLEVMLIATMRCQKSVTSVPRHVSSLSRLCAV
jgi:hypothetical protein